MDIGEIFPPTLHIQTLMLPAKILKIVSFQDFPITAAWSGHWLIDQAQAALMGKS